MYIFQPLNKDPQNPWSWQARYLRMGTLATGVLALLTVYALYASARDFIFIPGAAYTDAQFVRQTGSSPGFRINHISHTNYYGQYRYEVSGMTYRISETDTEDAGDEPYFKPTVRIAYKTSNPAHAKIIYAQTLQQDVNNIITNFVGIELVWYISLYLFSVFITKIKSLPRRRKAS